MYTLRLRGTFTPEPRSRYPFALTPPSVSTGWGAPGLPSLPSASCRAPPGSGSVCHRLLAATLAGLENYGPLDATQVLPELRLRTGKPPCPACSPPPSPHPHWKRKLEARRTAGRRGHRHSGLRPFSENEENEGLALNSSSATYSPGDFATSTAPPVKEGRREGTREGNERTEEGKGGK